MDLTKRQEELMQRLVFNHIDDMVQVVDFQVGTDNDYNIIHDGLSEIAECTGILRYR